jgi:hemerythrin-like domain-containing protein
MKPRGPLMIEHRLIENMIVIIEKEIEKIKANGEVNTEFIDAAVDFIRIYADKTHHGKEEDILFRDCVNKSMSEDDKKVMNDLVEEHKFGRKIVGELVEAKERYSQGDKSKTDTIIDKLKILTGFYPKHIEKEDKLFFPNSEKYFSEEEQQKMLEEFWEFDKNMIHEKYKAVVEKYE